MGSERKMLWWEYYGCGCVSDTVEHKKDLPGYCGTHGRDRLSLHREYATRLPSGEAREVSDG